MLKKTSIRLAIILYLLSSIAFPPLEVTWAQEGGVAEQLTNAKVAMDTIWTLVAAFLVMFMALGFALLESGFCRAKNTVNILAKNFVVFALTSIAFLMVGWGLMFGDGTGFIGLKGLWLLSGPDNSPATGDAYQGVYTAISWTGIPLEAKFLFQLVFAATAATIVSGAVAERIKFSAFFLFAIVMGGLLYPITGHWIWGGGWLQQLGMWDFAGSTVVHSVGGWAALAGAIMLGPRIGKYTKDGRINPIPGHSLTSAAIGVFVLWFGWFGFNPGSTMAADWRAIGHIATTTNTAAAAGAVAATFTAWVLLGKPDLTMSLNGGVAGLVAITAPCAFVSVGSALIIGLVAGILVVLSVLFFDRIKVDDPVGAISAHLTCGVWGTLSLGLFAQDQFMPGTTGNGLLFGGGTQLLQAQVIGILSVGAFIFVAASLVWLWLKGLMGIRVSPEEELEGLDLGEHGLMAYPDFQLAAPGGRMPAAVFPPAYAREAAEPRKEPAAAWTTPEAAKAKSEVGSKAPSFSVQRKPPTARRIGSVREAPPATPPHETLAVEEKPFKLVVKEVDKKLVKEIWAHLCHDYPHNTPQDFNDIYPYVSTFHDSIFTFRKGDPQRFREKLEQLLYLYGVEGAYVDIEP